MWDLGKGFLFLVKIRKIRSFFFSLGFFMIRFRENVSVNSLFGRNSKYQQRSVEVKKGSEGS